MDKWDILINSLFSIFVGLSTPIITNILRIDLSAVIIINFLIISLFWLGSYIKEIDKKTNKSLFKAKENEKAIMEIKEDLNINNRLNVLEAWKEKMDKKKGQINVVDLIKLIAIIIIGYLILRAFLTAAK